MDPITHALVGLAAGSFSGNGNVLTNPLALGCLVGSVIPDSDIIFQYWGDYAYLKNHRGVTHSIPGLLGLSALTAFFINMLFPGNVFFSIFLWTFLGSLTHVGLDVFNSYGAKVFWPFYDKKIGTGLLLIFDPFLVLCAITVFWFNKSNLLFTIISILLFIIYLVCRHFGKIWVTKQIIKKLSLTDIKKVVLLPSMSGYLKWDFIVHGKKEIITGWADIRARQIEVRDRLEKTESWIKELIMGTKFGAFFKDFAQEFHISCELKDDQHHITLTDLRYYIKNRYMHHATALFNNELELIQCAFHPYHTSRNSKLPVYVKTLKMQ